MSLCISCIARLRSIFWHWLRAPRLVFRKYKVAPRVGTWAVRRRVLSDMFPAGAPLTGRPKKVFEPFSFLNRRFDHRSKFQ
jgi:hypothetical protein